MGSGGWGDKRVEGRKGENGGKIDTGIEGREGGIKGMRKEEGEQKVLALIEERTSAKKDKNFKKADEIRNALLDMNVVIEDTRAGVKWSIKTNGN